MTSGNQRSLADAGPARGTTAGSTWLGQAGPRLALAAGATALMGAVYGVTNHWMAWRGTTVWDASTLIRFADGQTLDRWLPFVPWTITLYASLVAWYVVPAVTVPAQRERDFAALYLGLLWLTAVAQVVFLLLPAEVKLRDQVWSGLTAPGTSTCWSAIYRGLYLLDCPFNSWPCLHTAQPLLIQLTLAHWHRQTHRLLTAAGWVWWGLLTVSILTTKQHYVWDVVTGIALALGTWYAYLRPRLAEPR
jgi:hypothetical protein